MGQLVKHLRGLKCGLSISKASAFILRMHCSTVIDESSTVGTRKLQQEPWSAVCRRVVSKSHGQLCVVGWSAQSEKCNSTKHKSRFQERQIATQSPAVITQQQLGRAYSCWSRVAALARCSAGLRQHCKKSLASLCRTFQTKLSHN